MKKSTMKALIFFGIGFLMIAALIPVAKAENLYNSVIRIHVIANSDEKEDQEDKLAVRDAILAFSEHFVLGKNAEEAKKEVEGRLDEIRIIAENKLKSLGKDHTVKVLLTKEKYPTRHYDSFSLPAGEYLSLQVKIGEAKGKNWWCVLFPPMCLQSATSPEDALVGVGMDQENAKCITRDGKRYRVRFKIIELWTKTKEKIEDIF